MGHFFSRAFKRITQGNCSAQSARNQSTREGNNQGQQQQQQQQQQQDDQPSRPTTQSVPVGQSIDSAEYASLGVPTAASSTRETQQPDEGASRRAANNETPISTQEVRTNGSIVANESTGDHQGAVEEAVIKIQALVRGHLTRKALKDAHSHSLPPLNALGQSQFDEESLTRNPPSAVFSPSSPLMLSSDFQQQQRMNSPTSAGTERSRTPLESIAEVIETTAPATAAAAATANLPTSETGLDPAERLNSGAHNNGDTHDSKHDDNEPNNARALSNQTRPPLQGNNNKPPEMKARGKSMSPALSEAAASIDLGSAGCETPLTVSIDISDHSIRPNVKFATVLHHKDQQRPALPEIGVQEDDEGRRGDEGVEEFSERRAAASLGTPDLLESEEVAAIRIQSAFRGYRSRKNSPYRTRSPNSTNSLPDASERRAVLARQAAAAAVTDGDHFTEAADEHGRISGALSDETVATAMVEQRSGRTRQRDSIETGHDESEQTIGGELSAEKLAGSGENSANIEAEASQVEVADGLVSSEEQQQPRGLPLDSASAPVETVLAQLTPEQPLKQTNSSIDNQDSLASIVTLDTLDEPGEISEAALETWPAQTNDPQEFSNQQQEPKSRASLELDTDSSSVLGAALSCTEPDSVSAAKGPHCAECDQPEGCSCRQTTRDYLESEFEKMCDGMIAELDPSSAVDWATNQLAAELEKATSSSAGQSESLPNSAMAEASSAVGAQLAELLLNEEEQRAIELESDDIERRDPRGHQTSEERFPKSPQIKMDELKFENSEDDTADEVTTTVAHDNSGGGNLVLGSPEADISGRSLPGFNLSATNSSSNEDIDEEDDDDEDNTNISDQKQQQQQQQQQSQQQKQQPATGRTKNKRNKSRNKKKSKK